LGAAMIVDFTIENFRSIKSEQVFSLYVENPKRHLADNVVFPADDKVGVLRSAAIYGANASGKSNFLRAFSALRYIACNSGDLKEGQKIRCYEPYLLSAETADAPVRFSLEFINHDKKRYRYSVSFNEYEILDESLEIYPSRSKAVLFKREPQNSWNDIYFGGLYKGKSRKVPFFKNNSYLSKAGNSAGSSEVMRSVYGYIWNNFMFNGAMEDIFGPLYEDPTVLDFASKFLCNVDTGISEIEQKDSDPLPTGLIPENFPKHLKERILARTKKDYLFTHKMDNGSNKQFKRSDESLGTQKLFTMLPFLLEAFRNGAVLIIDEIDSSFHPHVAELIIKLFNDPETNINNAQLIFSTHSLSLMSSNEMRRDQIWFVEKRNGRSELYSLGEYDKNILKSTSPFADWYDSGRFGALPSVNYGAISNLLKMYSLASAESHGAEHLLEVPGAEEN
jgi:AAA15 family ATPase/GTPase